MWLLLLLLMAGCIGPSQPAEVPIVASIHPLYLVANAIDNATYLVPPNANPHFWEPTPSAVEALGKSKLYVRVGFEHWDEVLERPTTLTAMDYAQLIDNNPHVWLSPKAMEALARAIAEERIRQGADEGTIRQRLQAFLQCLRETNEAIREEASHYNISYVAYHPAYTYFARAYGLREVAVLTKEGEPAFKNYEEVKALMEREGVKLIFTSEQLDTPLVEQLAQETGAEVVLLDPLGVHATSYCELLRENWERIKEKADKLGLKAEAG